MNEDERIAARMGDLLGDERVWPDPDPAGADALLSAIREEAASRPEAPAASRKAGPAERNGARSRGPVLRSGRGSRILAAAAAVVLLAAVVGVVSLVVGNGGGDAPEVEVAATDLAPEVEGTVAVDWQGAGVALELEVSGLPAAEPGTYYQGWVKNAEGDLVTVGTFHLRDGDEPVELWSGVDTDRYSTLTVTRQQEGAGQESSGEVVLTARIGR